MAIYLVRHGQDEDNAAGILNGRRDTDLTEAGRKKATETGEKLKDKNIKVIYSSPLKRAQQTAHLIAKELKVHRIMVEQDLIERDFGELTGLIGTQTALNKLYSIDPHPNTPGLESYPNLYQRAEALLADLTQKHQGENILLVSHGELGKMLRAASQDLPWEAGVQSPYIENGEIIPL